jgi:hypothetical protein
VHSLLFGLYSYGPNPPIIYGCDRIMISHVVTLETKEFCPHNSQYLILRNEPTVHISPGLMALFLLSFESGMAPTVILIATLLDPMACSYRRFLLKISLPSVQLLNESQPNPLALTLSDALLALARCPPGRAS